MQTLNLATVKSRLSEFVASVSATHERVTITRNGTPAAVLVSAEDLASLEETIAVLSDEESVRDLAQSMAEIESGEPLAGVEDLRADLAARPHRER